jgi:arginyl-tRNA synthetase
MVTLPEGRMSTRRGRVIFLEEVLEEAITRARAIVTEKNPELPEELREEVARKVGIGAVKYADLAQTRTKNIVFDWDRMLSLDGDAAPYLQYTYTRTRSILRRAADTAEGATDSHPFTSLLTHPAEQAVLRRIAELPDAIAEAATSFQPHFVANELFRLSQVFQSFYREAPVLKAETPELRAARLALVEAVATVFRTGLGLLGIECPEQM